MVKLIFRIVSAVVITFFLKNPYIAQAADVGQAQNNELKLLRITPEGEDVPAGQQIVFQFDQAVVPIGRMERAAEEIPIEIKPQLKCEWRWLNTSALACQLREEDKMHQASRYTVVVTPGIATEEGIGFNQTIRHSFTTARPKATYTRFVNWLSPGTPLIQVTFNQPVSKNSVESSLNLAEEQRGNSIAVKAFPDDLPRTLPYWLELLDESERATPQDDKTTMDKVEARRVWIIEPVQELPLDTTMLLNIKPGLQSSEGPEQGIEQRTIVTFDTYPEFEFLGIRCTPEGTTNWKDLDVYQLQQTDDIGEVINKCAPLDRVALLFSSPVKNSAVRDHVQLAPPLDGGRKDYNPWENVHDWTHLSSPHRHGRKYQVWFPENLKAYEKYRVAIDQEGLTDEFGRKLNDKVSFNFYTAHRTPNMHLVHPLAVLEKNVDSDVPLYVTNLNSIDISYQRLSHSGSAAGQQQQLPVADAEDIAFAMPMGARKLLEQNSGVLQGSLHPNPRPPGYWRNPKFYVQVTPFQVHAKFGHFGSLVWVTDLATGKPVGDAKVTIFKGTYDQLVEIAEQSYKSNTNKQGLAQLPGISEIDPQLELIKYWYRDNDPRYFLKVEKDSDMSLMPLDKGFLVRSNGAYSYIRKPGGHTHAWGTTAQGVYKLGDTIEYKIYVREQSNRHWIAPRKSGYSLKVYDPQDKVVHEQSKITLSEFGAFDGKFTTPALGAVGWYRFELAPDFADYKWQPLIVLVSDFTPSPFKVKTELNGDKFHGGDDVQTSTIATLHSGGPYTDAEVRLTARLDIKPFATDNPKAKGFTFGGSSGTYLNQEQRNLLDIRAQLNDSGQHENLFKLPQTDIYYGTVLVESAVKDDRGKFVASTAKADYVGRDRFVGIRNTKWLYEQDKPEQLDAIVVDENGKLIIGANVSVTVQHREFRVSRVKGPGNAYLTRNIAQWVDESQCEITSKKTAAKCKFKPKSAGYYRFIATVKDSKQRLHKTILYGWVIGKGIVVWDQSDDATLQIIAEQSEYKIGDTARYLIKNPFPGAAALVTIERYGILDSWTQVLNSSTPVIEVPVKPDYLPGFYLSVVVVSPRVDKPISAEKVDLGKPSYRLGYVSATVKDPYKQLAIEVSSDKSVYKPRDKVKARIHVQPLKGNNKEAVEIAVAVVDESVLALNRQGKTYYDPYAGFNRLDDLDVNNYSLISRLIGRQKFEKKGANPGGGGGSASAALRNLFKFVSYWNPSIKPDSNGNANIEFTVPDNLTGWRILALAVTPDDRMGLGDYNYKVNRPTELRPVMPNQVTEGDRFKAGFSIMNRTDKSRQMNVTIKVDGPLADNSQTSFDYSVEVAPYKRTGLWLPIATKGYGELKFTATGGDRKDKDALEHKVPVNKRRSLETAANYGSTTDAKISESIHFPEDIYTDVGQVGVTLAPTVIGNVDGAFTYVKEYPYQCWEQRLTRAVMGSSYLKLKDYMSSDFQWKDAAQVVAQTLEAAANFQAPNGGMVYWIPGNQNVSPYLSAYTAIAFNWLRRDGYTIPASVERRLHGYLLEMIRKDVFPTFFSKGMSSSVRAVALAALADHGKVNSGDIQRYERHLPQMDLFGMGYYLQAAVKTKVAQNRQKKILDAILGHASQTGGKFQFNEPWDDSYKYILATPLRSNCAVLSSLLATQLTSKQSSQQSSKISDTVGDIPFKLVRSITQSRGNRDHWENTQENVFCMNSLIEYSNAYETEQPDMSIKVLLDDEKLGDARFDKKTDPTTVISRPLKAGDPGKKSKLTIHRNGKGRLYYSARLSYDLKADNPSRINSGIEIRREYSVERNGKWQLLNTPMQIKRGELVRVDLFVSIPTARHFVVVDDPVPGGLEAVNTQLATASTIDAEKGKFKASDESWWYKFSDWTYFGRYFWSFYHKELRHNAARFFADYLPAGNYNLSYTAQAIAEGNFSVMPVHAEEMYDPDVYGKGLPSQLIVNPE